MTPTPSSSRSARSEQERTGISPKRPGLAGKGAGVSTGNDHPPTQASETRADPPERCEACEKGFDTTTVWWHINDLHALIARLRSELAEAVRLLHLWDTYLAMNGVDREDPNLIRKNVFDFLARSKEKL